jgi:hypothetical protein
MHTVDVHVEDGDRPALCHIIIQYVTSSYSMSHHHTVDVHVEDGDRPALHVAPVVPETMQRMVPRRKW